MKKSYTVKDVARLLGFSTNTVYKYLEEGKIKATRLGKEGRFRIPALEINRLLPSDDVISNNDKHEDVIDDLDAGQSLEAAVEKQGKFSLFTWFISLNSILFGLSNFIFPIYLVQGSFANYLTLLTVSKVIMLVVGVAIIILDVSSKEDNRYKTLSNIILSLAYFIAGYALLKVGYTISAVGYGAIGFTLLLLTFKTIDSFKSFYLMVTVIIISVGILIFFNPVAVQNSMLQGMVESNRILFAIVWTTLGMIVCYINLFREHGNHRLVVASNLVLAAFSIGFSAMAFSQGYWERAIFTMNLGAFALVFPFWHSLKVEGTVPKKVAMASFTWVFALISVGIGLVVYLQRSFEDTILSDMNKTINGVSKVVENFVNDSVQKITVNSINEDLPELLIEGDPEKLETLLKGFYTTSGSYFRRYAITDSEGIVKAIYPVQKESVGIDFSDRNYFIQAKQERRIVVSEVITPTLTGNPPAIGIASPIYNENNDFLGMVLGSLSLSDLNELVSQVEFDSPVSFFVSDNRGSYVLNPNMEYVGKPVLENDPLKLSLLGKADNLKSYDENGELSFYSYRPLESLSWGISAKQPFSDAFRKFSITSYVIFLIVTISGLGSVLAIQSIRKELKA